MARSLNKVELIGNLTRDPELRYTPSGAAVITFGLATNRQWTTDSGEKKEDVEFHKIVAWNKLAELCGQLLAKGRKIYVEGRLQTRKWTGTDGVEKSTTEIVINDMIILDSRGAATGGDDFDIPDEAMEGVSPAGDSTTSSGGASDTGKGKAGAVAKKAKVDAKTESKSETVDVEDVDAGEDIPF